MRRVLVLVTVAAIAGAAVGCTPTAPRGSCAGTGSVAHRNLRYAASTGVAARLQSLDLYTPVRKAGCAAAPLVVWVHGGGFVKGDKSFQVADKITLFTREGWAFASVNYRLVGDPGSGATNGVYPAAENDVAAAVAYLERNAGTYALDARRVVMLGHSAGAFLVSLVSTDGSFLQTAGRQLRDVVCSASLDTTYDIAAGVAAGGRSEQMYRNAFGNDPAVWQKASPPNNVVAGKGIPSFHIVTRGLPGRVRESEDFGATLRASKVPATVQVVRGLSHNDVNDAVGKPGDTVVTPPLLQFFRTCVATAR